ncbi:hypothetical protein E3T26_02345 [Cryobacterium sp. TMT1-21]|uniref:DUF6457 domain-containing protein n=1 Tax=Cryobacterium shii TaxID=1259235 RepID=A0AAQ2C605_9MICO|nr:MULTISPECIES: DUF6457 domain-containing protein [Cryobacterium]TFC46419.1 hypothetical protein E3O49_09930 [Cryobacterium shii]TFC84297.1 hypothetical protein E3T24_10590 [Cryobacterium sp. TmT2-59]TFD17341.1 hypothetical protein E3T26_02345 [Cryobacterium sp. TMT1-21]TFD17732.1 hypothetical protein E3T32_13610 [Cryobacterium sp. TMT2-23]TFD43157.1 hypothetical protein E3T37_01535 [Cryobacterium sp. TMT2-10]
MTVSSDEELALAQWSRRLTQALQILDLEVDTQMILQLAEESRSVSPSAGPLSAFIVGFAAGQATNSGKKEVQSAVETAVQKARGLVSDGTQDGPDSKGWVDSAQ